MTEFNCDLNHLRHFYNKCEKMLYTNVIKSMDQTIAQKFRKGDEERKQKVGNQKIPTVNCRAPHLVPARLHFPVPAVSTK